MPEAESMTAISNLAPPHAGAPTAREAAREDEKSRTAAPAPPAPPASPTSPQRLDIRV
jgi:hypothetical protein